MYTIEYRFHDVYTKVTHYSKEKAFSIYTKVNRLGGLARIYDSYHNLIIGREGW